MNRLIGKHLVLSVLLIVSTVGCATLSALSGAPHVVKAGCAYDQAWSVALASVNEFALTQTDKDEGVIETDWIAFASRKSAGGLQRQVNEERARFYLNLEPSRQPITISVQQVREFYSPMGARSQGIAWKRIPPIAEEEQRLLGRITKHLLDKGCTIVG